MGGAPAKGWGRHRASEGKGDVAVSSSSRLAGAGRASPEGCFLGLGLHRSTPGQNRRVESDSAKRAEICVRRDDPIRDVCKAAGIEFQHGNTSGQDGYAGMLQLKPSKLEPNSCPRRRRDSDVYARDVDAKVRCIEGAAGSGFSGPKQLRRGRNSVPHSIVGRPLRPRRHPRRQPHDGPY